MPGPGAYMIGKEERNAVSEVMEKGYLFRYGSEDNPSFLHKVSTLEKEFAQYCGANYALATSSGTSAILVSLIAMGLNPGDEVIVPAYTFVATYTACIFAGLVPVLTEIDESLSIDPDDIEMLQDLVVAAVNDVLKKSQDMVSEEMSKLTGGIKLPGGMKIPGLF